jgi:transaldolase
LRLVWDCTDLLPEAAWYYLQALAAPETVMLLSPSTLELYREVSLLPTSRTEEQIEQLPISGLQMEISLDERVEQLVNEERARSLNAFHQLLDTIDHKRRR